MNPCYFGILYITPFLTDATIKRYMKGFVELPCTQIKLFSLLYYDHKQWG